MTEYKEQIKLSEEYKELEKKYNKLKVNYDYINKAHDDLLYKYSEMITGSSEDEELKHQYDELKSEYNRLLEAYDELSYDYKEIDEAYTDLAGDYNAMLEEETEDNLNSSSFDDFNEEEMDELANVLEVPDEFDTVKKPAHYNQYPMETIQAIEGQSTQEEFEGWLKGNIIKYVSRYNFKNGVEDLDKAKFYVTFLRDYIKGDEIEDIIDNLEEENE